VEVFLFAVLMYAPQGHFLPFGQGAFPAGTDTNEDNTQKLLLMGWIGMGLFG